MTTPVGAVILIFSLYIAYIILSKFFLPTIGEFQIKRARRRHRAQVNDDRHC
jgi:hypothetical protein